MIHIAAVRIFNIVIIVIIAVVMHEIHIVVRYPSMLTLGAKNEQGKLTVVSDQQWHLRAY